MDKYEQRDYHAPQVRCLECGEEMVVESTWKFMGYLRRRYSCPVCEHTEVITASGEKELKASPKEAVEAAKKVERDLIDNEF